MAKEQAKKAPEKQVEEKVVEQPQIKKVRLTQNVTANFGKGQKHYPKGTELSLLEEQARAIRGWYEEVSEGEDDTK